MRTTLEIDDPVLAAVRDLAALEKRSIGNVISELAQEALVCRGQGTFVRRNRVPLIPVRPAEPAVVNPAVINPAVTNELVNRIREEEGI